MENTSSMAFLLLQEVQFLEVKDADLSQWEFVNVLDAEEEPEEDGDEDSVPKGIGSWVSSISWSNPPKMDLVDGVRYRLIHSDDANLKGHLDFEDDSNGDRRFDDDDEENGRGQTDDEDEDVDDYNGFDLDDELVPWYVNSKFGRQRMRKLGKRAFSKMNNSKRSPHLFVRPGCVRGKHGLGLKHSY